MPPLDSPNTISLRIIHHFHQISIINRFKIDRKMATCSHTDHHSIYRLTASEGNSPLLQNCWADLCPREHQSLQNRNYQSPISNHPQMPRPFHQSMLCVGMGFLCRIIKQHVNFKAIYHIFMSNWNTCVGAYDSPIV